MFLALAIDRLGERERSQKLTRHGKDLVDPPLKGVLLGVVMPRRGVVMCYLFVGRSNRGHSYIRLATRGSAYGGTPNDVEVTCASFSRADQSPAHVFGSKSTQLTMRKHRFETMHVFDRTLGE